MPVWRVSEPYLTLWIQDEPLGYQPALGPRISFLLSWKQRDVGPMGTWDGFDPNIFSVGKRWNFPWLSYVNLDINASNVVHFAGGGSLTYNGTYDPLTNTRLTGDTTNGFTLANADGSKDVFGFIITNSYGAFLKAFMTERWNSVGQKTKLNFEAYTPGPTPVIRLREVVDGDGRATTITYWTNANSFSANLIGRVTDPFGRTTTLSYDSSGRLTNIADVADLSSGFVYDAKELITNTVTPYGATSFKLVDVTTNVPNGRAIEVTLPNNSKELYLYKDNAPGIPASFSTNQIPRSSPYTNTFENSSLDTHNTFHWGRLQYGLLSTNYTATGDINNLTTNDFLLARWEHWLQESDPYIGSRVSETLSLERPPSPDGSTACNVSRSAVVTGHCPYHILSWRLIRGPRACPSARSALPS